VIGLILIGPESSPCLSLSGDRAAQLTEGESGNKYPILLPHRYFKQNRSPPPHTHTKMRLRVPTRTINSYEKEFVRSNVFFIGFISFRGEYSLHLCYFCSFFVLFFPLNPFESHSPSTLVLFVCVKVYLSLHFSCLHPRPPISFLIFHTLPRLGNFV